MCQILASNLSMISTNPPTMRLGPIIYISIVLNPVSPIPTTVKTKPMAIMPSPMYRKTFNLDSASGNGGIRLGKS